MPSCSAVESSSSSDSAGYSRSFSIPSPRRTSRLRRADRVEAEEEGPVDRELGRVALHEQAHPLAERLLGGGEEQDPRVLRRALRERPRDRELGDAAGAVVVGAGHDLAGADVRHERRARRPRRTCRGRSVRGCRAARRPRPARGPPTAGHISGGLVSLLLEDPGRALADGLGDRWVEEEGRVGGVVMGHEDDRPLGVGGPDLRRARGGRCVFGSSRRKRRRPGGSSSAISAARSRAGRRGERRASAPAAAGREPGESAGARQQADRPPEGAVGLRLLLDAHRHGRPASRSAPASHSAARRSPSEADSALERAELVEALAHPGRVGRGRDSGG